MNSAQRRKANRVFQHLVLLRPPEGKRYFHHDEKVAKARAWCKRRVGKGTWNSKELWDRAEFRFTKEKDAVHFALKWS